MRILALETSTPLGSVALVEAGQVRSSLTHDEPNRHAERMLGLIDGALEALGWDPQSVERVAVGVGPGTFTGIRVGLALAQGLSLGLSADAVGVGSLRIVALGHPAADPRTRVVVRDARRQEYFVAAYTAEGEELMAPTPVAQERVAGLVRERFGSGVVVLGDRLAGLAWDHETECQYPLAGPLGLYASGLDPTENPLCPQYVRGPGADRPVMAPSPLKLPRV
jgi:tRNA threonylcarbamoyl adenosine modification protein YeaZ